MYFWCTYLIVACLQFSMLRCLFVCLFVYFLAQDYHTILFGSGRSVGSLGANISHAFCLPISLQELIDSLEQRKQQSEVCHAQYLLGIVMLIHTSAFVADQCVFVEIDHIH